MTTNTLRKYNVSLMTPAEKAIYDAIWEVEKVWADVKLTKIVTLLITAKDLLSDFIVNN